MKVEFMVIGAMKSATTTLAQLFYDHPQVNFCTEKEPNYFSKTADWKTNLKTYHNLFKKQAKGIYGEGSNTYTKFPHYNLKIWKDIYQYNPEIKFIYIVRHPVDRFISHYRHLKRRKYIDFDIEYAIKECSRIHDTNRYYTQIKPYLSFFGSSQVKLIRFSDFIDNQNKEYSLICDFLGIKNIKIENNVHTHKSSNVITTHYKLDWTKPILRRIYNNTPYPLNKLIYKTYWTLLGRKANNKPKIKSKFQDVNGS